MVRREGRVRLSAHERGVLTLTFCGMSSKDIAERMNLTPQTVDQYMTGVLNGLALGGRREIARYVLENTNIARLDESVLCTGTFSGTGHHPDGCECEAVFCLATRVGRMSPAELEEYRRQRTAV